VAQVLQLAQLVQHHGVAQVQVGRGRVQAQLDAQRLAALFRARQLLGEFAFDQQFVDTRLVMASASWTFVKEGRWQVALQRSCYYYKTAEKS
jgi:hypothetical protein